MPAPLTVGHFAAEHAPSFGLRWLAGQAGGDRIISAETDIRHIDALIGFLNRMRPTRVQVLGHSELQYYTELTPMRRRYVFEELLASVPACIIVADGCQPPEHLRQDADSSDTPLFVTDRPSKTLVADLRDLLTTLLTRTICLHGVMMEVLGMGVLLTGASGIGKSELALELCSRGHRLIADDAPELCRVAPGVLRATCAPSIRDFLEVRGLGILNIPRIFGDGALRRRKELQLIIHLVRKTDPGLASLDRLSGDYRTHTILGVDIPEVTIPVATGRNLAILVECTVRNHTLKMNGYDAATDLIERQQRTIDENHA